MLNLKKIYSTTLLLIWSIFLIGQDSGNPCPPFDPDCTKASGSIDDYLPLLLLMGMVIGVWIINRQSNKMDYIKE
ncbi:MAG: hypothetical protein KAG37_11890 [Flavobacteriales bacterium]|nr:hypothetical protein [Flavobacteriales bacterium]